MSKKNKKIQLPKRSPLLYLLLIIVPVFVFLAIAIPYEYISTYKEQKVYVFKDDVYEEIMHEHEDDEDHEHVAEYKKKDDVVWCDIDEITDFDLYLYCNEYNDGGTITFNTFGVKNENTAGLNITKYSIKLGFFNTWASVDVKSSSSLKSVTLVDKAIDAVKKTDGTAVNPTISVPLKTDLPKKGPLPFTTVKELPLYAYINYTIKQNGENITKKFVIKLDYDDYMIEKTVLDAGTANETFIKPSAGGIRK